MKASGDDGVAAITIESDELRFSSSVLYIAVYGLHIDCSGCDEVKVSVFHLYSQSYDHMLNRLVLQAARKMNMIRGV
jgi:hypothetical protein